MGARSDHRRRCSTQSASKSSTRAESLSAAGLRLDSEPAALSAAWSHRIWREPSAVGELAKQSRWQADVLTLPPHPQLAERDGQGDPGQPAFGALEADALLEGAQRAGYHLVVADLGSVLEDGHRQLIDQSDLVLGIVRPTLESLPDVFRLASVLRAQGMGRKLGWSPMRPTTTPRSAGWPTRWRSRCSGGSRRSRARPTGANRPGPSRRRWRPISPTSRGRPGRSPIARPRHRPAVAAAIRARRAARPGSER